MNMFKYHDMVHETKNARITNYIDNNMIIVQYDEFNTINNNCDYWKTDRPKFIQEWLSFNNKNNIINIPIWVVKHSGLVPKKEHHCCVLVENGSKIVGVLLLFWYLESQISDSDLFITGTIGGRGLFDQPFDLANVSPGNMNGIKYINKIQSNYIFKQSNPTPYQPHLSFNVGFVVFEIKGSFIGDVKEIQSVCGLCGGNARFPCHYCLITHNDISKPIDINNRNVEARFYEGNIESLQNAKRKVKNIEKGKNDYIDSLGMDHAPLFEHNPGIIQFPLIHIESSDSGKLYFLCKYLILSTNEQNQKLIEKWSDQIQLVYNLEGEVNIWEQKYKMSKNVVNANDINYCKKNGFIPHHTNNINSNHLSNDNININSSDDIVITGSNAFNRSKPMFGSIRPGNVKNSNNNNNNNNSNDIDMERSELYSQYMVKITDLDYNGMLKFTDTELDSDSDDSNVMDINLSTIQLKLDQKKQLLKSAQNDLQAIETQMQGINNNNILKWNKIKQLMDIDELSYRNNELTGPMGIKLVNNWHKLIPFLKEISEKVGEIAEKLFPVRKFLVHSAIHKNNHRLTNEFIIAHKLAICQDDYLTQLFFKEIQKIVGKLPFGIGNKHHLKVHYHSKMEYTRATPSHMDDQFSELVCKGYKNNIRFWRNRITKKSMRTMNLRSNCQHFLQFDQTNINQ